MWQSWVFPQRNSPTDETYPKFTGQGAKFKAEILCKVDYSLKGVLEVYIRDDRRVAKDRSKRTDAKCQGLRVAIERVNNR